MRHAPIERAAEVVAFPALVAARQLRDWSPDAIDDWGRDPAFAGRVAALSRVRWEVEVGGAEHLPPKAGALIVVNARRLALAPLLTALALSDATSRPVRFVGRPDVAPLGPLMQRVGALIAQPAEVRGALAAGELVVVGASHRIGSSVAGAVDRALIGAALAARARVHPAATISSPVNRAARVEIAPAVRVGRIRRGPLAELELAELVEHRIDELLIELSGGRTTTSVDWLVSRAVDWVPWRKWGR